jgi:hypothetical protein
MEFADVFDELRGRVKAKTRRDFLTDVEGQIDESEKVTETLEAAARRFRYVAITFDRQKNDSKFSYPYFDELLIVIDGLMGGTGIYKPNNQMRALRWGGKRGDLIKVMRFFAKNDPRVNFRRALVLPFPNPPAGYKIDRVVFKR